MVVIPGLINTHHHLFQNLTRCYPKAQNESLFGWLTSLYPVWNKIGPSDIYISSLIGLSEMVLSGLATISQESGMNALGGIKYFGQATMQQTSGFSAIGSLKWEDQTVADTIYTDQTPATTTWTDQSSTNTNWTDIAA